MASDAPQTALRVLVVEDEYLIALEVEHMLEQLDCETLGPVPSVAKALAILENSTPDFALIDVNLGRERSTAVADVLKARSIPYALATGYDSAQLPEPSLREAPRASKPVTLDSLRALLAECIGHDPTETRRR